MASAQPMIRQVKIVLLIPQFITMALIILIYHCIGTSDPFLYGILTYLVISVILRQVIPRNHRSGIRLYKNGQYGKAISEFQKSYDFFTKHRWIDKYRYVVLLSSSRISYLEMSLVNMAYCYSQLGQGNKSKELYEKALLMFPDSQIAVSALKMLNSVKDVE